MKLKYKHINFERVESGISRVVVQWWVMNNRHGDRLAWIDWHPGWKQYVMTSEQRVIWSADCLRDVSTFMAELAKEPRP